MRLTVQKALALAILASLIPGRRAVIPVADPAAPTTSSAPEHPAVQETAPTPDQHRPKGERS
jgi:hypothetical protein